MNNNGYRTHKISIIFTFGKNEKIKNKCFQPTQNNLKAHTGVSLFTVYNCLFIFFYLVVKVSICVRKNDDHGKLSHANKIHSNIQILVFVILLFFRLLGFVSQTFIFFQFFFYFLSKFYFLKFSHTHEIFG